jgi:ABC-type transport system involved in multi-copper enzyme maturation permease subunit
MSGILFLEKALAAHGDLRQWNSPPRCRLRSVNFDPLRKENFPNRLTFCDTGHAMWPVILRELRAGSRRWTTYWLRLLAAGTVLAAIAWLLIQPRFAFTPPARAGHQMFLMLHWIVLAAIWIIVPMLTADTLSREKREGTLGLLFLTNLSARAIVFAKGAAAGLLALTLWLSVVPIMTVPVLMGGVPSQEIIFSCSVALGSICCALAAGLMASAVSRHGAGAVAFALSLSWLGHFFFCTLVVFATGAVKLVGSAAGATKFLLVITGVMMTWSLDTSSAGFVAPPTATGRLATGYLLIPLLSFLLALFAAWLAAFAVRRNWQDKPKSKRQTDTEKFFCSPVFLTGVFRAWMRRSLECNPIGWLEKRRVTGRIMSWIWLAVMGSFATTLTYGGSAMRPGEFNPLMWMLLISIAYVAAGSFRRERETGALELILVTPLSERQIINGRLRGLWSQFLPTFVLWAAVVIYLSTATPGWRPAELIEFTVAYFIVPVVGLYFSLRSRFVLLAWLATMAVCFAVPQLFSRLVSFILSIWFQDLLPGEASSGNLFSRVVLWMMMNLWLTALALQLILAALLFQRLRVNLVRRSFSLR